MAKSIPKWVMDRYSVLWKKFKDKKISYKDIKDTLKLDDKNTISVFLNELRKAEWIGVQLDEEDTRKRSYILKSPEQVIAKIEDYPKCYSKK